MQITSLHASIGTFNGTIYFLVDGRLLTMEVCTPNFNDYNEFRISDIRLAKKEYEPEGNTVYLTPYDIKPFEIDEKELAFLDKWFTSSEIDFENEADNESSPFHYLDPNLPLTSCNFDTGYRHAVFHKGDWQEELDCFKVRNDTWKLTTEIPKAKLYEDGGMYSLLAHISEGIFNNYYD